MGLSSKQHKKDLMEDRSPVDSSRNTTKKTGSPTKKTKAREVRDLSRNAEADGDTAAGRYEAKRAVEVAAEKRGPVRKDGSMKGDQSATHKDYANYKGTDKGYHGKTGASHGDQSATHRDYEEHGHMSSVHKVLKHSHRM
tara:strand:+ start:593 stop:1012 length:420 start_codon:yes stop_codon:yes gene_type:complete